MEKNRLRTNGRTVQALWPIIACSLATTMPSGLGADLGVTNLLGFTAGHATRERTLEKQFDANISAADQREWMQRMSAEPNQVGSAHDRDNAEFMLAKFREWGWDAEIETFYVLYPTPKNQVLELVSPRHFAARLFEPPVSGDQTSDRTRDALPPYNIYGADGDVTAELVYVNYGMPDDYQELDRRAIGVKGRIVIARYGGGWRGLKPKLAYEHGAVGCIIYSDPHEDGYAAGDVYPKGAYRPPDGVQRGSVEDMPVAPGDPLTPGIGATKDAKRLSLEDAKTVLKIPVLPISSADAQPLLEALAGPEAPSGWRGSLAITYHIGPGPAKVHLAITSNWEQKPVYDVIARLQGSELPDQWVIRGNHHDGWVFGAWDPLSANVALMSEAKAIGALVKEGWRPKRTLVYAGWDGEEPGLLGSTEWVEAHSDELRHKAVLYVNSDTNGRGFLRAEGSHSCQELVNQVAAEIRDPETGATVLDRLKAKLLVEGNRKGAGAEEQKLAKQLETGEGPILGALGSGSDYTPFLQHAGIASLDIRYGGEDKNGGIYHSIYDSFDHFVRFGDPGFAYGVALSQTIGRVMLRVANADIIPLRFGPFAKVVGEYSNEIQKLANDMRNRTEQQHRLLDKQMYDLAADPTEAHAAPKRESDVPYLNFAPLENALSRLRVSAKACDEALGKIARLDQDSKDAHVSEINGLLQSMEQTLLYSDGLPGRDWYRHMIYAPGLQTGYGAKTLPGVREAVEQRHWKEAEQYIGVVGKALDNYSDRLEQIVAETK